MRTCSLLLLFAVLTPAEESLRHLVYGQAVTVGGQIVPTFDKGYLIYLHQPNRLQVFTPDGSLWFDQELACPGTGTCSAGPVAADSRGNVAVGFGYWTQQGKAGGIRILSSKGQETRFIETGLYVPSCLAFDRNDELWALGWQRDAVTRESEEYDYTLVRRFSLDGKLKGQYLPRSLWPGRKSDPGAGGRGYWRMYAASDRIGAIIHESHADNVPEWIEWDLDGNLLTRTVLPGRMSSGRAFTAVGRLYARFPMPGGKPPELRVLDTNTANWTAVSSGLPDDIDFNRALLLGADGPDLVYSVGHGNTHLVWARPGSSATSLSGLPPEQTPRPYRPEDPASDRGHLRR